MLLVLGSDQLFQEQHRKGCDQIHWVQYAQNRQEVALQYQNVDVQCVAFVVVVVVEIGIVVARKQNARVVVVIVVVGVVMGLDTGQGQE